SDVAIVDCAIELKSPVGQRFGEIVPACEMKGAWQIDPRRIQGCSKSAVSKTDIGDNGVTESMQFRVLDTDVSAAELDDFRAHGCALAGFSRRVHLRVVEVHPVGSRLDVRMDVECGEIDPFHAEIAGMKGEVDERTMDRPDRAGPYRGAAARAHRKAEV